LDQLAPGLMSAGHSVLNLTMNITYVHPMCNANHTLILEEQF
jgi:hypothetical protein